MRVSISDRVPSPLLATHTEWPMTASALGAAPTGISVTTRSALGSMRATLLAKRSATHTARSPTAIAPGPAPVGIGLPTTLSPSIFETTSLPVSLTHVAPAPTAIALTLSTPLISTGCRVRVVSKRVTAPYWPTHSEDASTASGCGVSAVCSAPVWS